jgi:hypothetical protein
MRFLLISLAVLAILAAPTAMALQCSYNLVATYEYDYGSDGTIDAVDYEYELVCWESINSYPTYPDPPIYQPYPWNPPTIAVNHVSDENPYNAMISVTYGGDVDTMGIEWPSWMANSSGPTNTIFMGHLNENGYGYTTVTVRACDGGMRCASDSFNIDRTEHHTDATGAIAVTWFTDAGFMLYPTHYSYDRRLVAKYLRTSYTVPTAGQRNGYIQYDDWHDGLGYENMEDIPRMRTPSFRVAAPNLVNMSTGQLDCWGVVISARYTSHGCGYIYKFARESDRSGTGIIDIDPHSNPDYPPVYDGDWPELSVTAW